MKEGVVCCCCCSALSNNMQNANKRVDINTLLASFNLRKGLTRGAGFRAGSNQLRPRCRNSTISFHRCLEKFRREFWLAMKSCRSGDGGSAGGGGSSSGGRRRSGSSAGRVGFSPSHSVVTTLTRTPKLNSGPARRRTSVGGDSLAGAELGLVDAAGPETILLCHINPAASSSTYTTVSE